VAAALYRAGALTGRRPRAVIALVLALALAGAVVLTALTSARTGERALDRFIAANQPGNVFLYTPPGLPPEKRASTLSRVQAAVGDVATARVATAIVSLPGERRPDEKVEPVFVAEAVIEGPYLTEIARPIVLDGRVDLGEDEVVVNELLADGRGIEVGDDLEVAWYAPEDLEALGTASGPSPTAWTG